MISSIIDNGISRIYAEDFDNQQHYLEILMKEIRKTDARTIYAGKGFFVPNENYISEFFGKVALDPSYDFYDYNGDCVWQNQLVLPIFDVVNKPVGLVGFDPIEKAKKMDGEKTLNNYYRYSNRSILNRGNYIYTLPGVYEQCVKDGYAVLVDGVFDCHSLYRNGINAISLLGSSLTEQVLYALSFIKHLFLAVDNDEAGLELYYKLKKRFPRINLISQGAKKDADDVLTSDFKEPYLAIMRTAIENNTDAVLRLKPKQRAI